MRKNITLKSVIVTLVLFAACFISMSNNGVQAAGTAEKVDDYYVQQYTADEANGFIGESAPTLSGYIFSGWYVEKACTTPIREKGVTEPCYAKFVKETVLAVKCQTAEFTEGENTKSNLRFVSSVDGKNYSAVGFEIVREDGKKYHNETAETYKRIEASTDAKVSYEYSPQVIDTESSSFITYTIKNIPEGSYGTVFYVQPFWKTLDGVKVFGVCRYVAVSDCEAGVVNIPVKVTPSETGYTSDSFAITRTVATNTAANSTSVANVDNTIVAIRYTSNSIFASLIISENIALKSLTMYEVSGSGSTKYLHRNLNTAYSGSSTVDYSWYNVANAFDSNEDEYVIATSADLYGFATKTADAASGRQVFANKTIYLVADIAANDGVASSTGITNGSDGKKHTWTPISANASYKFNGTFDGNHHSVSGIYISNSSANRGLFSQLKENAVIKNLKIENSYISGAAAAATIAGQGGKEYSNIIVANDVYIKSSSYMCGGIVGKATMNTTIKNCEVAATLTVTGASDSAVSSSVSSVGGMVGNVKNHSTSKTAIVTIENCVFAGVINGTHVGVGGMVGQNQEELTVRNCRVLGQANINSTSGGIGGIVGDTRKGTSSYGTVTTKIENCQNAGSVKSEGAEGKIGGISGSVVGACTLIINNCSNSGVLTPSDSAAILGYQDENSTVTITSDSTQ